MQNEKNKTASVLHVSHPGLTQQFSSPVLSHYQMLFITVSMINLSILSWAFASGSWWDENHISLGNFGNMVIANLCITVLIRQQYLINGLFRLVWRTPVSWPLKLRRHLAKVYHFGGLHSGCAMFSAVWLLLFTLAAFYQQQAQGGLSTQLLTVNTVLVALLAAICLTALPQVRRRYHNLFEHMHRYAGWSSLALSWLQVLWFVRDSHHGEWRWQHLSHAFAFWGLLTITCSILLPWLRLRRVAIKVTRPSSHAAIIEFALPQDPFPGSTLAISLDPLAEWHAFANIPLVTRPGCRMLISRAGDWTGRFIDNPPSHVWFKGIPTPGVGSMNKIFKSVVYVATGSGIGPLLPHLVNNPRPCKLIWSTRNPVVTYGEAFVNEIIAAHPGVLIWDTDAHGKPDLLLLACQKVKEINAEAVICIANRPLTDYVVEGCEAQGIAAYGAIWDS
ncbi:hypothetical protein [Mixta sp. Marseille-Q2659]|uniref:hypothetical protein n=1 Tax=Mixta sp. Marseille-Q2659 TaxID=2736607 RepID=UPI0023BA05FD|nr:hypothetical protein [Mixta sp. Marseille-Q2659]